MLRAPVGSYIYPILYQVQECMRSIYSWFQTFLNSIFQSNGRLHALMPLAVISIAVSIIFVAIIIIKKVVWGK